MQRPLALLFMLLLSFTCSTQAEADQAMPGLIPITLPGGAIIHAELADTPQKRAEGLMYRERLAPDHGMLFTFLQPQAWTFWMKNTKISLDIIWMNEKKQVIHIESNVPICTRTDDSCPQYRPNNEALYVLELAGGTSEKLKIERGVKLRFPLP
ncbi:MAG: hypothetical protein RL042_204 [Nitrospirota bacterium]